MARARTRHVGTGGDTASVTSRGPNDGDGRDAHETEEATRRTRLATERTYLAWWRTGLAAFAVSLGAGRLVPAIAGGPQLLYSIVGLLFAALGVTLIIYGRRRGREVDQAISEGGYRQADERLLTLISALALLGGLLVVVLILLGR